MITSDEYDRIFGESGQGERKEEFFALDEESQLDILDMFAGPEVEVLANLRFKSEGRENN